MKIQSIFCAAALLGLTACVVTVPELKPETGSHNLRIETNLVNGRGPSQFLTSRKAWLHVASLNADCSTDKYLGRSVLGEVSALSLAQQKPHAIEVVINVKAGFDLLSKKSLERRVFIRQGYSYVIDANLEPNNDLVDLYEIAPNGTRRRIDQDYNC
jgi:hypothetical protein